MPCIIDIALDSAEIGLSFEKFRLAGTNMNPIGAVVDMLGKIAKLGRVVANIGPSQLIKQLDALRSNLEQFKEAVREDDISKMHQLLAECEAESDLLEKRLFTGLDEETNKSLGVTIRRARASKRSIATTVNITSAGLRKALKSKRTKLAGTIAKRDEKSRQKLIEEIDRAIGKLRGISKSLESFKF